MNDASRRTMIRPIAAFAWFLFFPGVCAFAQQPTPVSGSSPSTEIVVTVKVTGNDSGKLHGLTKDDFKVTVGGKQRSILSAEELADNGLTYKASLASSNLAPLGKKKFVAILLDEDVRMAARSPLQFTALPVEASFGETKPPTDGKRTVPFRVFVPPGHIRCDEKKDNLVLVDLAYRVVDGHGREVLAKVNPLKANLNLEQRQAFMTQGLNLNREFDLPSGTYTVRFIVRDNLSGKTGSVFVPLKVE